MTGLKREARVWSNPSFHGKIEDHPNYLTLLRQLTQKESDQVLNLAHDHKKDKNLTLP
jgi:hypothetical protein